MVSRLFLRRLWLSSNLFPAGESSHIAFDLSLPGGREGNLVLFADCNTAVARRDEVIHLAALCHRGGETRRPKHQPGRKPYPGIYRKSEHKTERYQCTGW